MAGLRSALELPFGPQSAEAQTGAPELGTWVMIKPDDTVVIRVVRAEMGQGSLTGLAQLVAEELECDWSKVTTEVPTPGQSLARKRVFGNFNSSGSRAIRESQEYVRKGGAAAREMLKQAAANQWKVPVSELTVSKGVITHKASNRTATYGKLAEAAAKLNSADPRPSSSRIRRTGPSPASRSSGSTRPTRSTAHRNIPSTSRCPGCSAPRSRSAR